VVTTPKNPLYDTHGNMVATLTKNANGTSRNVGNERSYDVWGGVRTGADTGGPKGRYCANLGHVQDDESGLIYMRARYYEPSTGRFISEDLVRDGSNWYVAFNNAPSVNVDSSGFSSVNGMATGFLMMLVGYAGSYLAQANIAWLAYSGLSTILSSIAILAGVITAPVGLYYGTIGVANAIEWRNNCIKSSKLISDGSDIMRSFLAQFRSGTFNRAATSEAIGALTAHYGAVTFMYNLYLHVGADF
jgi:RHS repeat-associated protein